MHYDVNILCTLYIKNQQSGVESGHLAPRVEKIAKNVLHK